MERCSAGQANYDTARHPKNSAAGYITEFGSRVLFSGEDALIAQYPETEKMTHKLTAKSNIGRGQILAQFINMATKNINYIIIGVIVVLLAVAGYFYFGNNGEETDYYQYSNGFTIFDVNILSETETQIPIQFEGDSNTYSIILRNDPASLEDVPLAGNINQRVANDDVVVISIDPEDELKGKGVIAIYELTKFLESEMFYNKTVVTTVTSEYEDKIVVNCDHASDTQTVILIVLGDETQVYTSGYCVVVMGTDEDELIRAADRLAYHLIGIMS